MSPQVAFYLPTLRTSMSFALFCYAYVFIKLMLLILHTKAILSFTDLLFLCVFPLLRLFGRLYCAETHDACNLVLVIYLLSKVEVEIFYDYGQ